MLLLLLLLPQQQRLLLLHAGQQHASAAAVMQQHRLEFVGFNLKYISRFAFKRASSGPTAAEVYVHPNLPMGAPVAGALGGHVKLPNPLVFLDIALFADQLPITAENFRCLCTGETGLGYYMRPRWYKGSPFHRVIPGFMAQGGDFHRGDGYGGESIYGQFLRDEKYLYKHSKRGLLSMAKGRDRHSASSQFFITFKACPWLDGQHVVFGQLEDGQETLDAIEAAGTPHGWLRRPVEIFNWYYIPAAAAAAAAAAACAAGVIAAVAALATGARAAAESQRTSSGVSIPSVALLLLV
ncbi:hypothetical protein Efla_007798 [Eimeria flavescens]